MAGTSTIHMSDALRAVHFSYTIQRQHVEGSVSKCGQTRGKVTPEIAYIDIMPRLMDLGKTAKQTTPVYDNYSALVNVANQWLSMNRQFKALRCETIQRKMETLPMAVDERMFLQWDSGTRVYVRGLRLWLIPNPYPSAPPQEIRVIHKVPVKSKLTLGQPLTFRAHTNEGKMVKDNHPFWLKELKTDIISFEGHDATLQRLNDDLEQKPLSGSILNLEVFTHICHLHPTYSELDPDRTYWYEDDQSRKRFVKFIRLFYVLGTPTYEKIDTKIFYPDITRNRQGINPTVFKPSANTFDKLGKWISTQNGNTLVTIQTMNTRYIDTDGECNILTDSMDDCETPGKSRLYVETLRVYYTSSSWNPLSKPLGTITSKTFIPIRLGDRQYETMSQTMYRIVAWLKVTGLHVLDIETFRYNFNEALISGIELNKANFPVHSRLDSPELIVIRIYFPYPFQEPLPQFLPKAVTWSPIKANRAHLYHARRSFFNATHASRILNEPSIEDITSVNVAYQVQVKKSPYIFFDEM